MIADEGAFWAMRRKVAPPAWLIATPTLIVPPMPRALPSPVSVPATMAADEPRDLDTDWLPSRSFGGCNWA